MRRREVLGLGLAALSAPLVTPRARAQAKYPERPIRLVIPFPPGGVNDAIGRPWADKMKPLLGTVVIENMGGAGGAVGALAVARAQPDGYTLLLGSGGTQVIIPIASSQPTYDPVKAFETISLLGVTAVCIAVHPSVPVHTLPELIAYAKANPGKLSYGSAGSGTMTHLTGELFKVLSGAADIVHIPYRGGGAGTHRRHIRAYSDDHPERDRAGDRAQQDRQAADYRRHDGHSCCSCSRYSNRDRGGAAEHDLTELRRPVCSGRDAQAHY